MKTSETQTTRTRDGVRQLERRWVPEGEPRATMILVHGLGEHSGRYERTGRLFADAGVEVRAHDVRGHGETEGTRGFVTSFGLFLADVEEHLLRGRQDGRPVILLGHSMGGLIAAAYGASERAQPDMLVLSAPALEANVPGWKRALAPHMSKLLPKLRLGTPIARGQLSHDTAVEDAYFSDPLVQTSTSARLGDEVFGAMASTTASLSKIRVPTFVIHGGSDTVVPTRFSEPLETLENVTRKVYPELRHESFNEPEGPEVVADIMEWIDGQLAKLPA